MFYTVSKKIDFEQVSESIVVLEQFSCQGGPYRPDQSIANNKDEFPLIVRYPSISELCIRAILTA
jgi:hypothetical protein